MIHKFPVLRMEGDEKKPDRDMIRVLCAMGIPMGLQYSITAIGSVILQAAVNSLGSMAVAAVSTGSKISMFFCTPFDALGGTMATWAGQNVGAKKLDRVREGVRKASLMGFAYSAAAFAALFFCGRYLALLFVDSSETELIRQISTFLICNSMFYIPLTLVNVVRFAIQGMGFSTFAILAGVCEMAAGPLWASAWCRCSASFRPLCQPTGLDLRGSVPCAGLWPVLKKIKTNIRRIVFCG